MIAIDPDCTCGSIGQSDVRLCHADHRYWKGDKELVSVSTIIRAVWPYKPNFMGAKPSVLANALNRGIVVDRLFSKYLAHELQAIPIGTRLDSLQLFWRLKRWWEDHKHGEPQPQRILNDGQVAGTPDVIDEPLDRIEDLKTTYAIEPFYPLQLGAYGAMYDNVYGKPVKELRILHLTKRFPEPKLIVLDPAEVIADWLQLRDVYFMAMRRMVR